MKTISVLILSFILLNTSLFGQEIKVKDSISKDSIQKATKKVAPPKIPFYYIDENGIAIKENQFIQKCGAAVFYCKRYDRDKMVIFKVHYQMYFGKISPKEYGQIRLYLNKKSPKTVPENHNILIHYEEFLSGFNERNEFCNLVNSKTLEENFEAFNLEAELNGDWPFESLKAFKRHVDTHKREFHDEEKFNREVAEYADQQNNCIKKIETKYQTPVFYIVKENYNYPIINQYFTWVVDSGAIKNGFLKKHPDADFILLKPDGEYFIKTDFLPDFVLSKLLKNKSWESQKKDWKKSIQTNFSQGFGIVNDMTREYEYYTPSCY